MIIGGVAVIALGIPRLTVDIDATVAAAHLGPERLAEALGRHGIQARIPDAIAFARARQVFLGVHEASGTPVDVSLAWLPFEDEALRACRPCARQGFPFGFPVLDLLIDKLIASRPRTSKMPKVCSSFTGATMNLRRVREVVHGFARALDDAERPQTLERLIRKTGLEA